MENYIYILLILGAVAFLVYLWLGKSKNASADFGKNVMEKESKSEAFPLRMQAYERLALFLERNKPESLLMRLLGETESADDLQILLLNILREEFEHNFSQQIYISEALWQHISLTKDKLMQLVNKAAAEKKEATAKALSEELLLQYTNEEDFVGQTLQMLRKEARNVQK